MQLDPSQLAALDAAVSEGTFEAAARRLRITPSAVSQRIRALENSVGRVLLTRSKPTAATDSGRVLLRLARQLSVLTDDVARELGGEAGGEAGDLAVPAPAPRIRVPLAVNADSLATWLLPALAELAGSMDFDFHREDESHTTALLRDGTVMAAVSAVAEPVQGCTSMGLGVMRYAPVASRGFVQRWFPELERGARRASLESLRSAPVVVFDHRDELQHDYLLRRAADPRAEVPGADEPSVPRPELGSARAGEPQGDESPTAPPAAGVGRDGKPRAEPPRHFVPASADFVRAVAAGYGWGMVPEAQSAGLDLVQLDPGAHLDVPLYWQQWQLRTATLDLVASTVAAAARTDLRPLRPWR
ncbi:ArgP/LysG family DNA-binding transcriptional regulator [Herbiconiux sp. CPCC 203407]|uniref:ArgP/LysG family DNA-binding transcriptional regulator n=1 Tax=Herbiconiux oxytropis TaxID=2970915 RepID=A0AA41XJY2_9MICO|nr:ArgP/LysG family DNA-binding transcriptional regulator [Herbiconiux oxytropis]MCS5722474.1 ArgP/LysG family DNA-binding transcriptional regulator [Herbiconiux oxytropis]MCS5727593.1 ArgP/LysG family DNA-binding transcriptional regulator [Herbiconiux oxytropis]